MTTAVKNTEDTPVAPKPVRLKHPAYVLPGAMEALQSLGGAVAKSGLPPRTVELLSRARANQRLASHRRPSSNRPDWARRRRLFAVAAAYRRTSRPERAAFAHRSPPGSTIPIPCPKGLDEAARHYDETRSPAWCSRSPASTSGTASTSPRANPPASGSRKSGGPACPETLRSRTIRGNQSHCSRENDGGQQRDVVGKQHLGKPALCHQVVSCGRKTLRGRKHLQHCNQRRRSEEQQR